MRFRICAGNIDDEVVDIGEARARSIEWDHSTSQEIGRKRM